ncbi:unnamed protein product [Cladocopium goreaui]|uniref:Uncharacterized protein n=1 Tax=Cladocopium goreaui TaxID=2562237 RepID=A0A9P1GPI5_9DINO|nr:unnamed protein product [Cladocopium goreaui]
MPMGRSQSMPKVGPPQPGRHNLQRPASGGALAKGKKVAASNSCSALHRSESLAQMPAAVRLEFFRYSTPLKGPMGRINVKQVTKNFKFYGYVPELELRSVMAEQVMQIKNYAVVNCYNWSIPASTLNFYHIHEWVVRPATRELNSSMMEHLSPKKLVPNWFVSHYWGENLEKFLDGLKQHLTVRNLSGRTGYWIGAFASRHQDFATAELGEMSTTPLAKVAEAAHFRMLLITDASPEVAMPAALFTRTWCTFELALCLDCTALCVDVCAVRNKDAEVLTCGLTSQEICSSKYCPGVGIHLKQQRERNFPLEVAKAALDFSIEKTHASREEERQRLLGCMALPLEGEEQVETYQRMTRRLRSFLLLAFWPHVLCRADLQDKAYMSMLLDMAKGIQGDYWRTSLSLMLAGCDLAKKELLDLAMQSLMSNLEWLKLDLQFTNLEDASLSSLAKALPPKLKTLGVDLAGCSISDRGVFSFLSKLPNTVTKVTMKLQHTKVTPGLLELSKDGPCALLKWSNLSHSERVQALKEKMEIIEGRKNPLAAPNPSQVNRKVALENLAILPPNAIADQVLQQVKADLANLMGEGHP